MATYSVRASTVRNALAAVRRQHGLGRTESLEVTRSGGEDGLWRVTLADGSVVEVTIYRGPAEVHLLHR